MTPRDTLLFCLQFHLNSLRDEQHRKSSSASRRATSIHHNRNIVACHCPDFTTSSRASSSSNSDEIRSRTGMHMRQFQTMIANPNQPPFSSSFSDPSHPRIRILAHNNSIYLYAENVIFAILSWTYNRGIGRAITSRVASTARHHDAMVCSCLHTWSIRLPIFRIE